MQGVDFGKEPPVILFSATSALSGSQGLIDECDKTSPFYMKCDVIWNVE